MPLAFVQQAAGTVTDGSTLAYGSNVGNQTLLVACITLPSNATVDGITDTLTNTWARAVQKLGTASGAGAGLNAELWYAACPTGGANTVTFNWSGASNAQVNITEFSGFTDGVTLDQFATHEVRTTSDPNPCGEITTTQGEEVLIATLTHGSAFSVSSRLPGWNGLTAGSRRDSQYKINTASTETTNGEVTYTTGEETTACIASFYTTADAGGGGSSRRVFRGMLVGRW